MYTIESNELTICMEVEISYNVLVTGEDAVIDILYSMTRLTLKNGQTKNSPIHPLSC